MSRDDAFETPSRTRLSPGEFLCLLGIGGILLSFPFGRPLAGGLSMACVGTALAGTTWAVLREGCRLRFLVWVAGFAAASIISARQSDFAERSLERLPNGLMLLLAFPAGQVLGRSVAGRRWLSRIMVATLGLSAVDIVWQATTGRSILLGMASAIESRQSGSLPNPNDIGFVPIIVPLAAAGLGWGPIAIAGAWSLAWSSVALSGSRNAILGLTVSTVPVAMVARPGLRWAIAAGISLVGAVALALDLGGIRQRILDTIAFQEVARLEAFRVAWDEFLAHPWFGAGPCVFFEIFARAGAIDPEFVPALRGIGMPWVHNVPLELLAERGAIGTILFAVPVSLAIRELWRALRSSADRFWALAVAASLVAFAAMSVFDLTLLKDWCSTLLWLVIGLACHAGSSGRAEGSGSRGSPAMRRGSPSPANPG